MKLINAFNLSGGGRTYPLAAGSAMTGGELV